MCAMEMVAWLAGEPHSDEPSCACPVIAAFTRACNDAMSDEARNRWLRPLVPLLVNSRSDTGVERARGYLAIDVLVRRIVPARLRRQRRDDAAELLAELPPIRTLAGIRAALRAVDHFARDDHGTRWVLQRAIDEMPPARFVAGALQVAKATSDAATWSVVSDLIRQMAAIGAAGGREVTAADADGSL